MSKVQNFLADRLGWPKYIRPFLYKQLPSHTDWSATLGSAAALFFLVQVITGIFLALYYNPAPEHAYQSINFIMDDVALGELLRGIHHWSASILLIIVFLHMVINFFQGTFKAPREVTWIVGVLLFLLTVGFGFTGYLLPWDQKAFWATTVGVNMVRDIPVIGEFCGNLILGGEWVSGITLTRFYTLHMLILPALMAVLVVLHIYLVRLHDLAGPPRDNIQIESEYFFYPDHLFRSSVVFLFFFLLVILLSLFAEIPLEKHAGVTDPDYVPRPEWYFMGLFELLTYFPGKLEVLGSFVIPVLGLLILILLPFLSRTHLRKPSDRPVGIAAGVTALVAIVFLTTIGIVKSQPYGEEIVLPDRKFTQSQSLGLEIYMEEECSYCHTILGEGGRREGPDLSNIHNKNRDKKWLIDFIEDPQSKSKWAVMPQYKLADDELEALADFMLALDFSKFETQHFTKEEASQLVDK